MSIYCSVTRPKIWYLKLEVNQHELVKLFLIFRYLMQNEGRLIFLVGYAVCGWFLLLVYKNLGFFKL